MSDKTKVYVAGVGMVTPVGFDAPSTSAAVRARISAYQESVHINKDRNPMKMALVPEDALPPLHDELDKEGNLTARHRRMLRLAACALVEVIKQIPLKQPPPLFLAVPELIPGVECATQNTFMSLLQKQSGVELDLSLSRILAHGRAGGVQAIDLAFKYFESTGNTVALVGGVDTYQDQVLLAELDKQNRIQAEGVMDGFAPGEAAGFLVLISEDALKKLPGKPKAMLYPPGLATETGHRYSEEPYRGDGLATAFRLAIEQANGEKIQAIYASLNGESFSTKEHGVALIRNKSAFVDDAAVEHPADCFGDIGAAFGPVLVGLMSMQKSGTYLGYCASEQQPRSAVVLNAIG